MSAQKVIEVFRFARKREIPVRSFRDHWNICFPSDKLQCRDYGYRDIKGLLANVHVLQKIGGKYDTRYVLRGDIAASIEVDPTSPASQGADFPLSPSSQSGATSPAKSVSALPRPRGPSGRSQGGPRTYITLVNSQCRPEHLHNGLGASGGSAPTETPRLGWGPW